MSELEKQQMRDAIQKIDAVLALAKANFPRNTDVTIRTSSDSVQSATITIPWYALKGITDAGRSALADEGGKR